MSVNKLQIAGILGREIARSFLWNCKTLYCSCISVCYT